ncbi:MAG TPA: sterol desaturase family protein [Burkholderiales bacterium]|nr:sterol desaturase family protein [Burkholderiales bacterium]
MDTQTIAQGGFYLAFHLTKALTAFIQRDSFLYWPFLLSAAVIALAVAAATTRATKNAETGSLRQTLREYVSRRVWWHASARADYRLYLANALVLPLIFAVALFGDRHIVDLINQLLVSAPVTARPGEPVSVTARIAFTLCFFIAYDFGRFVAHSLLHDVPVLWEFHKVHHSAETLTPFTTFRAHPIDLMIMAWVPAVMTGMVTWGFNQLTAVPVSFYSYLGMHVIVFASNLVGTLRHTNVWFSYGPAISKWLVSPAQHQLHHSCELQHLGCNRGFELAVWDRLYGTLYVPQRQEAFRLGLGDGTDGQWHTVRRMWVWPFVNATKRLAAVLERGAQPSSRAPGR